MFFHIIASGSKGNATIIGNSNTKILVDMGISFKALEKGLKEINVSFEEINYAFFTHEHADHIKGLKFLSPKKCYSLEGTLPSLCNILLPFKEYNFSDFKVIPIQTSHDANNPCGYIFEENNEKLVYITDTGFIPENIKKYCKNPTFLIIESNHDIQMLMKTNRPFELKNRILSDHGHLCNEDSALFSKEIIYEETKEIVLAHISQEANTPELALTVYNDILKTCDFDISKIKISCASQNQSLSGGDLNED